MNSTNDTDELQTKYAKALESHEQGELNTAVKLYRSILRHLPDADLVQYNLGLALYTQELYAEAATSFLAATELNPGDPDYWFNAALALKQSGRYQHALAAYEKALTLSPNDADILYNMGCCHQAAGDRIRAMVVYEKALAVTGNHSPALNNLAYCAHLEGDYDRAASLYQQVLVLRPDHLAARYMVEALSGENISAPPPEYIQQLFDAYSESFEQVLLGNLSYRVPSLLKDLLADTIGPGKKEMRVVDLGCGTGLSGQAVIEYATFLIGVDLSANMVEEAGKKGCYDQLIVGDVVKFLQGVEEPFDLFLAADVLTYLGDLEPFFQATANCTEAGALLCFSTEHGGEPGWRLQVTGRYGHHQSYVQEMAAENGWQLMHTKGAEIRKERDQWIAGDLYIFKKI